LAFQLSTVITAARDRHSLFHPTRITNAVLARFLSDWQNETIGKAVEREKHFMMQSASIVLSLDAANAPGTVGAGTSGGLPGAVSSTGALSVSEETTGALVEISGTVVVVERVATAATANTISSTGAGRTTDQDLGRVVVVTAGKGKGQIRSISTNSAAQWTVSQNWDTTPDTTSLFEIRSAGFTVDNTDAVVTALPSEDTQTGFLVRINAQGVPYIDYTKPLVASVEHGVQLPSMTALLGGTCRYVNGDQDDLTITSFKNRFDPLRWPAIYPAGETVRFCGSSNDWLDVLSLELHYAPIAPVFTALTDYFLLPDSAKAAAVARAAAFMALRVDGTEDIKIDAGVFEQIAESSEDRFLKTLRLSSRARTSVIRAGAY
jgi:hypothetical protein